MQLAPAARGAGRAAGGIAGQWSGGACEVPAQGVRAARARAGQGPVPDAGHLQAAIRQRAPESAVVQAQGPPMHARRSAAWTGVLARGRSGEAARNAKRLPRTVIGDARGALDGECSGCPSWQVCQPVLTPTAAAAGQRAWAARGAAGRCTPGPAAQRQFLHRSWRPIWPAQAAPKMPAPRGTYAPVTRCGAPLRGPGAPARAASAAETATVVASAAVLVV